MLSIYQEIARTPYIERYKVILIYLSGNSWDTVHRKIQSDFDVIIDRTNLRLNHGKTKAMLISIGNRLQNLIGPGPFNILERDIQFVQNHYFWV